MVEKYHTAASCLTGQMMKEKKEKKENDAHLGPSFISDIESSSDDIFPVIKHVHYPPHT